MDYYKDRIHRSTQNYTFDQCIRDFKEYYKDYYQEQLESPMPWVGMYIAAASATCTLAMAADVFNGFRRKKLWFPSKYFSLNAFSLTVLAVAMKLPVDLTTQMAGVDDRIARISALVLMSTAMANFVPSLGSIGNNEIMLNLAALGILVITIVGNVCIRLYGTAYQFGRMQIVDEELGSIGCMFFLLLFLLILCSSSVMVPTAKTYIELQYNQMHKRISDERVNRVGEFTCDELRVAVRRYWVMSESGDPQFVTARSVMGVTSGIMCLSMAITLLVSHVRIRLMMKIASWIYDNAPSSYKWSIDWILFIQSIGVAVGTIAPLLRWFTAAKLKSTKLGDKSFKDELKVEAYWTQRLMNWRESPIPLKNRNLKFRKTLHDAKRLLLNFCIGVQILLVRASKLVLLISAVFVKGLLLCFSRIKDFVKTHDSSGSSDSNDLNDYVLLLEDEPELPKRTLKNICSGMDKLIRTGKKNQSKNLINLLQKSVDFNGVREFNSSEVRRLHSQEPRNCWSLPVVTLTSIAISLPNVTDHKSYQLISAVSEGLHFAQVIGKTLDSSGELVNMRKATDVVWVGIELYKRWQDKDLRAAELKGRTHKETLQNLADIAQKTVTNFTTSMNNSPVQDPLNWPVGVIAANSMYRITQTILLAHDDDHPQTDEELFERLSIMISDILAACLTNIARVISLKCHSNAIEEREESIRQAALLLGESEVILETLQQRELPNLDPEVAADIEGWRAFMEYGYENPVSSSPQTNSGHVFV